MKMISIVICWDDSMELSMEQEEQIRSPSRSSKLLRASDIRGTRKKCLFDIIIEEIAERIGSCVIESRTSMQIATSAIPSSLPATEITWSFQVSKTWN